MSFPRYPRYKDSGVEWLGEVPEHWAQVPLKYVSTHNDDVLDEKTPPDAEIAYVDISSVDAVSGIKSKETMLFSSAPSRARRRVQHGDVIVSTVRTYLKAIAQIRDPEENMIVSTGFAVIRPRGELVPDFLGYLVSAGFFVEQVIARSTGVSYPAINASELVRIPVPFPDPAEQTAIAAFLDRETAKIDGLVLEQRRLMELLKEKRQAVISHVVTKGLNPKAPMKPSGIEWLGDVPEHWSVKPLRRFSCLVQSGPFGSQLHANEYVENCTPVINPTNLVDGTIVPNYEITITDAVVNRLSHQQLRNGDVVFSRRGELGRCALVTNAEDGWLCGTGSMILRLQRSEYNAGYLSRFFSLSVMRQYFESYSIGSVMDSLSSATLLSTPMVVPPVDEQGEISQFINAEAATFETPSPPKPNAPSTCSRNAAPR